MNKIRKISIVFLSIFRRNYLLALCLNELHGLFLKLNEYMSDKITHNYSLAFLFKTKCKLYLYVIYNYYIINFD